MSPINSLNVLPGATAARAGLAGHRFAATRRARPEVHAARETAAPSAPRRIAAHLQTLVSDGEPVTVLPPAAVASRGFAQGNGFLSGGVVDRRI